MALIHCHFFSQVLQLASTMTVILPEPPPGSGGDGAERRYPTLYLLHGRSDDHTAWQRRTSIERYVEGLGLAVVMPEAHRSFYTDMARGYRYWTFISEEVPALARHFFPLSGDPAENYVAGLSMGGYGAFKLALTYPERYAAAASLSGALDVVSRARADEAMGSREMNNVFGAVDELAGGPNDLFHLAGRLVERGDARPRLYQWCGLDDILYADNVRFREHARAIGLDVTYEEGPGAHEWRDWDRQIQRVLAWLPGLARP